MANSKTNPTKTASKTTPKTTSKAKKTKASAPAPAPAPDPVVPETKVENVEVEPVSGLEGDCSKFLGDLQNVSSQLSALKTSFRALEKAMTKELKAAQKLNKKKKTKKQLPTRNGG